MDWATRTVLAWRLSNTQDSSICQEALQEALERYGRPEIFNTDQGSQFTSRGFIEILEQAKESSLIRLPGCPKNGVHLCLPGHPNLPAPLDHRLPWAKRTSA